MTNADALNEGNEVVFDASAHVYGYEMDHATGAVVTGSCCIVHCGAPPTSHQCHGELLCHHHLLEHRDLLAAGGVEARFEGLLNPLPAKVVGSKKVSGVEGVE